MARLSHLLPDDDGYRMRPSLSMYDPGVDPVTAQAHAMSVRALPALTLLSLAVLSLAMLVLAAPAEAREARLAGPGGGGSNCGTDYETTAVPDADLARAAPRTEPEKPVSPRGAESDIARPPRWHSFLPGMFR